MKIDYSNKKIKYSIKPINGADYLIVPYLFWQKGKLNEIKKQFSKEIKTNAGVYNIDIIYPNEAHNNEVSVPFPPFLYRDFKAKIVKSQMASINYGSIINNYVKGNNNLVEIHQENNSTISSEIKKIIENENLCDIDKNFLELFVYKLNDNHATQDDANKVIDILTKMLPMATAAIELIKSVFFA